MAIKLSYINWYTRNGEIGIMIEENFRGKNYASMIIKKVFDLSFSKLGLHKLTAGFMNTNIPMKRAFLKNKFKIERLKKTSICYI